MGSCIFGSCCNIGTGCLSNLFPHPRVHKLGEEFVQLAAATALTSDCKAFTAKEIFASRWPHPQPQSPVFHENYLEDLLDKTGHGMGKPEIRVRHQYNVSQWHLCLFSCRFICHICGWDAPRPRVRYEHHDISEKYSSVSMNLTHSAKDSKGKFTMNLTANQSQKDWR